MSTQAIARDPGVDQPGRAGNTELVVTPESTSPVLRAMWVSAPPERERVTRGSTNQVLLAMLELVRRAQAYATPGSISPVQPAIQRRVTEVAPSIGQDAAD